METTVLPPQKKTVSVSSSLSPVEGRIRLKIDQALSDFGPYRQFRSGMISGDQYVRLVEDEFHELEARGLNEDQAHLSSRFPEDEEAFVDRILGALERANVITTANYDASRFDEVRAAIYAQYKHEGRSTYIFPEEERLVFALASILQPKKMAVFGSYYGYWSIWAIAACTGAESSCLLVDMDPEHNRVALRNAAAIGLGARVEAVTGDAVEYLKTTSSHFDFVLVDAEGPDDHPRPTYRKKAIYGPIFEHLGARVQPGGVVAAHNMLLTSKFADRYFERIIARNRGQYETMLAAVRRDYRYSHCFDTTEGVGIYCK